MGIKVREGETGNKIAKREKKEIKLRKRKKKEIKLLKKEQEK